MLEGSSDLVAVLKWADIASCSLPQGPFRGCPNCRLGYEASCKYGWIQSSYPQGLSIVTARDPSQDMVQAALVWVLKPSERQGSRGRRLVCGSRQDRVTHCKQRCTGLLKTSSTGGTTGEVWYVHHRGRVCDNLNTGPPKLFIHAPCIILVYFPRSLDDFVPARVLLKYISKTCSNCF